MTNALATKSDQELLDIARKLDWYHSVDLGHGFITPGHYDHRPYLHYYHLPDDLNGKTALDIGAASGFFSFELEQRGAKVTATDLPTWFDHDFGPNYQLEQSVEGAEVYLHQPFEVARQLRKSTVQVKYTNIYDITPETVGVHDIVFCGSVLIHLTDPIKALWRIANVTQEKAIIATSVVADEAERSIALMIGTERGDAWWIPTRMCLELMAVAAGFVGIEWVSEFQLDYRDGQLGPYHGVLHAYKSTENWTPRTRHRDAVIKAYQHPTSLSGPAALTAQLKSQQQEIERLQKLVRGYENGRVMRLLRWLQGKG